MSALVKHLNTQVDNARREYYRETSKKRTRLYLAGTSLSILALFFILYYAGVSPDKAMAICIVMMLPFIAILFYRTSYAKNNLRKQQQMASIAEYENDYGLLKNYARDRVGKLTFWQWLTNETEKIGNDIKQIKKDLVWDFSHLKDHEGNFYRDREGNPRRIDIMPIKTYNALYAEEHQELAYLRRALEARRRMLLDEYREKKRKKKEEEEKQRMEAEGEHIPE